jgi:uncharacterized protein
MNFAKFSYDDQILAQIAKSFNINELYIFGSAIREDFSENSDIDLVVVFNESSHYSLFDVMEIKEKFESFFGRDVDLVEKEALRNPYRREAILNSARKIYAA